MNTEDIEATGPEPAEPGAPSPMARPNGPRRISNRAGAAAGAVLIGGGALVALLGPLSVSAASPSPDPSASVTTTTTGTAAPSADADTRGPGGPGGGMGGHVEAVSDTSVAAKAIGISEADLVAAIQSGKTIAAVATANNIDPQKVIDALTQDGLDELAAAVKAGTITQAQADAQKPDVATRAANQVNNTRSH